MEPSHTGLVGAVTPNTLMRSPSEQRGSMPGPPPAEMPIRLLQLLFLTPRPEPASSAPVALARCSVEAGALCL